MEIFKKKTDISLFEKVEKRVLAYMRQSSSLMFEKNKKALLKLIPKVNLGFLVFFNLLAYSFSVYFQKEITSWDFFLIFLLTIFTATGTGALKFILDVLPIKKHLKKMKAYGDKNYEYLIKNDRPTVRGVKYSRYDLKEFLLTDDEIKELFSSKLNKEQLNYISNLVKKDGTIHFSELKNIELLTSKEQEQIHLEEFIQKHQISPSHQAVLLEEYEANSSKDLNIKTWL